jgi:gliding motility associated protien GldN
MKLFSRLSIILLNLFFLQVGFSMSLGYALGFDMDNNSQQGEVSSSPAGNEQAINNESEENNPYAEYNKNSIKPIPEPHILFKKRIWRQIYLKESKNKPLFARDKEITKFIIQGVKEGILQPYTDETFTKEMNKEQFLENLKLPQEEGLSEQEKALGFVNEDSGWGNQQNATPTSQEKEKEVDYFLPNQITTLELVEDLIFNKVNSSFVNDVQAITLILPEYLFPTGLRRLVGTFKYKDLAAYLDSKPKEALWINVKNSAGNMKMTEAIELRLFDSRIIKIENPDNLTVEDIYNKTPKASLRASQELEQELIELDYFLWEN